eukprot:13745135-Alexandrium_andersonii.AAC.1
MSRGSTRRSAGSGGAGARATRCRSAVGSSRRSSVPRAGSGTGLSSWTSSRRTRACAGTLSGGSCV